MIAANIEKIKQQISTNVKLVAVSKTQPISKIEEAYACGQRLFGENKVQEMCEKHAQLPKDIEWHMIGHLQTNKIKYIAPFVSLIHSVDSNRLLKEIDKEAAKNDRTISCLLQVHIADEETKYGFDEKDLIQLFEAGAINSYSHVQVSGLMGMATFTDDLKKVRQEFAHLKHVFSLIQSTYFASKPSFNTLSMGMSGDYLLAIEEGSNMIRVGSTIFGERIYQK